MSISFICKKAAFKWGAAVACCLIGISSAQAGLFDWLFRPKVSFPVTQSNLVFGRIGQPLMEVYWLDNERVMLPARFVQHHKDASGQDVLSATPLGIYIWDIKRNTYQRYADLYKSVPITVRYDHGYISYMTDYANGGDLITMMIGKMGQEKPVIERNENGSYTPETPDPSWGPHTEIRHRTATEFSYIYTLLPRDGYIDAGRWADYGFNQTIGGNPHVKMYRPNGKMPIELPILQRDMSNLATLTYSDYLNKYVLVPAKWKGRDPSKLQEWTDKDSVPIYLISPAGRVEKVQLPAGPWRPDYGVYPTRQGLFWISNYNTGSAYSAGGWLFHEDKVVKLFNYYADGAGVSPDGCTIVYSYNDGNPKTNEFVQAMHLCDGQKK